MRRLQIQLTEEQTRRLREVATSRNESMAGTIREAVEQYLTGKPKREALFKKALAAVGKYRSGKSDISQEHDRYLAEDFGK